MFRLAFLVLAATLSAGAFASTLQVSPTSPIIMDSDVTLGDGTQIHGPWFKADYTVQADETITVTGLHIDIISADGQKLSVDVSLSDPVELQAGESMAFQELYVSSLPQASSDTYDVQVTVLGWNGDKTTPSDDLNFGTSFQTM